MLSFKTYSPSDTEVRDICYFIFPGGLRDDLALWIVDAASRFGMHMVAVEGVDWNNDLTPWEAPGVFKSAKPFGGRAADFMQRLREEVIIPVETGLLGAVTDASHRRLAGVSLSGMFALWASISTSLFGGCVCISGSMWYDGFARWISATPPPEALKELCMVLGEREKNSRDRRMCTVEDMSSAIAGKLASDGVEVRFMLVEGTHFSPVVPRLELAFGK